jgi:hypothetical protein
VKQRSTAVGSTKYGERETPDARRFSSEEHETN